MKGLRKIFFRTLYLSGYGNWLLKKNKRQGKVPVLVFHKIIPEFDPVWPGMHPRLFDETIRMLEKHYRFKPLKALLDEPAEELKDACFLTFDDGYYDFVEFAYPILRKHNAYSSLFVIPSRMTYLGRVWTSTIIFFVKHYTFEEVNEFMLKNGFRIKYVHGQNDFWLHQTICLYLCDVSNSIRQKFMDNLNSKLQQDGKNIERELLDFDELLKLDNGLVEIHSHSLSHPSFAKEFDEDFIDKEMKESKRLIEEKMKKEVYAFAYPFSKFTKLSQECAKKYYKLCFTDTQKAVDLRKLKQNKELYYDLPRYNIYQKSAEEIFFLINGFHEKFKKMT